jgi:hypothetical protein
MHSRLIGLSDLSVNRCPYATNRMSSLRQRRLFGCQLVAGWPLIVSQRLGENKPSTSLIYHTIIHTHTLASKYTESSTHLRR